MPSKPQAFFDVRGSEVLIPSIDGAILPWAGRWLSLGHCSAAVAFQRGSQFWKGRINTLAFSA